MLPRLLAVLALLLPAIAPAATVSLRLRGPGGQPLADAVVTIDVGARKPAGPIRFPWPYVMAQQNITFQPHVLIVPVGATVTFPNRDKVRHHVYSFSAPKKFELKLYGREEARSVTFDRPGIVAIGCNIHDAMSGFIVVVDTPLAGASDASGMVTIANVPAGAAVLRIWHPSLRAPGNQRSQPVAIPAAGLSATLAP